MLLLFQILRKRSRQVKKQSAYNRLDIFKRHMLLILRAYGVSLEDTIDTKLSIKDMQLKQPARRVTPRPGRTCTDLSMSKRKRSNTVVPLLDIDGAMLSTLVDILSRSAFPPEVTLDFMWLLFTKSTNVINIDGFVSTV
jgi:hypothetical protein